MAPFSDTCVGKRKLVAAAAALINNLGEFSPWKMAQERNCGRNCVAYNLLIYSSFEPEKLVTSFYSKKVSIFCVLCPMEQAKNS